jgi:polar amino acid transport system permease protein
VQVFGIAAVLYLVLTNAVVLVAGLIGRVAFKPPLRPSERPRPLSAVRRLLPARSARPVQKEA